MEYARRTNQVIVTSNHDLMLICAEVSQRFVWLDPRGRQCTRAEQVLLVFSQIETWEEILGSGPDICVRAMRTKCEPITAEEAARLAEQRMHALRRRQASRKRRALA